MPQHRGMQVVGEVTDVLRQRGGALVKRPKIRLQLLADLRLFHSMLEAAEGDRQAGQLLAHVVVQVARDSRPLGILGLDQPAGQVLDLPVADLEGGPALANPLFGVLALGDVDVDADVTRKTASRPIHRDPRGQHPSVRAVGAAHPVLHEEGPARLDRRNVDAGSGLPVIRMHGVQPALVQQLLDRQPRELRAEAVDVVECRVWPGRPDHAGRAIQHEAEAAPRSARSARSARARRDRWTSSATMAAA